MKLQLWRNATIQLSMSNTKILIDPMLGEKGSFGVFPWTKDKRNNPLVDLPFSQQVLKSKIKSIDAVFISHLHPDHWDEAAVRFLDESTPIICPGPIKDAISGYGFTNIHELKSTIIFNELDLVLTKGKHGTGEIGEKMGLVNGLLLKQSKHRVYIAGDTIFCKDVTDTIDKYNPQHIIVAGGAATFEIGKPVTMTCQDIQALADYAPKTTIWITHLESITPCTETRKMISEFIKREHLELNCKLLDDGEEVDLIF